MNKFKTHITFDRVTPWLPIIFFFLICILSGWVYKEIVNPSDHVLSTTKVDINRETGEVFFSKSAGKSKYPVAGNTAVHIPQIRSIVYKTTDNTPFSELKYRLLWSASVVFFFFSFLCVSVVSAFIFRRVNGPNVFYLVILLVLLGGGVFYQCGLLPFADINYFNEILLFPLERKFKNYDDFVTAVELLGFATLLLLAMASSLILFAVAHNNQLASQSIESMVEKQGYLRALLHFGVLALVAGTIEVSTLYTWGMQLVEPEILAPVFPGVGKEEVLAYFSSTSEVAKGFSLANGVFYSMLLAAIFTPAFVIMNKFAKDFAHQQNPEKTNKEKQEWLEENDLASGIPQRVVQIFLALAPAVVGVPVVSLIESIG